MPSLPFWVLVVGVGFAVGCGASVPPASPDPVAEPTRQGPPPAAPPTGEAPPPTEPGGIRKVTGIQIAGHSIEDATAEDVAQVLSAAGYEVRVNPPQPCGNVDQLNFSARNEAASAMVAVFRIIEPVPGDDCTPTPVSDYVDTWRHKTEGDNPTTVMVHDEAAPALVVVNAMEKGGQAEAQKLVDALLASSPDS